MTTIVVWTVYFGWFWADVSSRQLDGQALLWRFAVCMGISLVVMIGLNVATGVMRKDNIDRPADELERQIEAKADRIGFRLLEGLVPLGLIAGLMMTDSIKAAFPDDPAGSVALIFANGTLMAFVFTELVREATQIVSFRMTA